MNNLSERLCAYGVNWREVMERFVGDEDLYYDCLRSFIEDPSFDALEASIKENEYAAAFDHAHTLKGVAGNLGLAPLYKTIDRIVESLRNGDFSRLTQQYEAVLTAWENLRIIFDGRRI